MRFYYQRSGCKKTCMLLMHPIIELCLLTGLFVTVSLNLTCLHCLQHSFFEHLFNVYYLRRHKWRMSGDVRCCYHRLQAVYP